MQMINIGHALAKLWQIYLCGTPRPNGFEWKVIYNANDHPNLKVDHLRAQNNQKLRLPTVEFSSNKFFLPPPRFERTTSAFGVE